MGAPPGDEAEWLRSLPSPAAVGDLVRGAYALDVTSCVLVRSLVNDVYRVTTPRGRFALKVYRHGGRSLEVVAWEQDLATHAQAEGVRVAIPVAQADGRPAGEVAYPEGSRPFTLSSWVEGRKPQPPFTGELFHRFGDAVARFHTAADSFHSAHRRPSFDVQSDLDDPLAEVLDRLSDEPADCALIRDLAEEARRRLHGFGAAGVSWGVCHGDVSLDNIHLTDQGVTLHDFDRARAGWRAGDLTGVGATTHWDAFAAGYRDQRELRAADLDAVPWLTISDLIANLRFHLVVKPMTRGTESLSEGWVDRELASLRTLGIDLL